MFSGRLFLLEQKLQDKLAKKAKGKTRAPKKAKGKKQDAEDLFTLDNESEVELYSLGFLFLQLSDADSSQDDAEPSHADAIEVTITSSDSEPLPR